MSRRVRAMAASLRSGRSESSWRERGIASGVRGVMRILSGISRRWFAGLRRREWPRRSRRPRNANTGRLGTSRSGEPGAPWMVRDNSGRRERRGHGPMWSHRGRAWQALLWARHNTTVEVGQSVGLLTVRASADWSVFRKTCPRRGRTLHSANTARLRSECPSLWGGPAWIRCTWGRWAGVAPPKSHQP
jgi:hypothetical protein